MGFFVLKILTFSADNRSKPVYSNSVVLSATLGALPPDFMRNLMQQISQYAAAVATSTATATGQPVPPQPTPPGYSSTANSSATTTGPNTPTTTPTAPPPPPHTGPQPQARVVFTRPSFSPNMPPSAFGTRGTTINVRAAMPGQQPGQVRIIFSDVVPVFEANLST